MIPGSPLLRDLADHDFPDGVRLTSIYSQGDSLCPPSSCRLDVRQGAHLRNVDVAYGGHLSFLFRARIASIVCRELGGMATSGDADTRFGATRSRPPGVATFEAQASSTARAA
jgi:hypothetical protein